jgi:hypothetical protein
VKAIRFLFRAIGGVVKWTLLVFAFLIVIGIVIAVVEAGKSGNSATKPVAVTGRLDGAFVRTGCLGCGQLTAKIATSDTYCGWHGSDVIVHVTMKNTSAEKVTVNWHPSYSIVSGNTHGGGLTSIQSTGLKSGQRESVFVRQAPKGVTAGSRIARCYPSFENVSSG